jgi:hypothetical protein
MSMEDTMRSLRFLLPLLAAVVAAVPLAASADSAPWHVYNLAASGRTLTSPQAAGQDGDMATFDFLGTPTTSYLLNHQLAGDLTGKTITATYSVTGDGSLFYDPSGNIPGSPMVRIFFQTSTPGSFAETDYWWSHAGSSVIAVGDDQVTIQTTIGDGSDWSDFYGHYGSDPTYSAAFEAAVANATYIGLSFGGGDFFANGVGDSTGTATFHLVSFEVS